MNEEAAETEDDRVIVVGSGPCGAAAAMRLVERGVPVLMLDAGLRAPGGQLLRVAGRTRFSAFPQQAADRLPDHPPR